VGERRGLGSQGPGAEEEGEGQGLTGGQVVSALSGDGSPGLALPSPDILTGPLPKAPSGHRW